MLSPTNPSTRNFESPKTRYSYYFIWVIQTAFPSINPPSMSPNNPIIGFSIRTHHIYEKIALPFKVQTSLTLYTVDNCAFPFLCFPCFRMLLLLLTSTKICTLQNQKIFWNFTANVMRSIWKFSKKFVSQQSAFIIQV